jgi:NAD(P)-dependent dehydrogenase (short-subunit alcohol dehydrogenase family)
MQLSGRLSGKVAIVVGAGQTPGETIGNGRATAIVFAREGARVLLVDRRLDSADETRRMIVDAGGEAETCEVDVTSEADCRRMVETCVARFGRVDVLHNNVGIGTGDASVVRVAEEAWDRIFAVNLKSVYLASKHALPVMRAQRAGAITSVSSAAAVCSHPLAAYKTSKAAVNALTQQMAIANAKYGVRVNAIMPGLMNTPMAIETIAEATGMDRAQLIAQRDAMVPLGGKMGTAWDVAHAALFLASDEARFITGVVLPVDGGQCARVG